MGFSRQEYWSRLLFPSPVDLPDPGIETISPVFPALTDGFFFFFFTTERLPLRLSTAFSSVQSLSHVWLVMTHEPQHARPPYPSSTPRVHPNPYPSSQWCHPTISSSVIPFSSCLNTSQHQGLFQWVSSSHQGAKVLEFQLQHQSFQLTPRTDLL